ncbi:MAG TPA: hypothetical protein PKK11_06670 [Methanothrix sp.]|nr:hypothetical protein [Methanothrix sp.]HPT20251.1 hypothetical protein [Methanothrix sp.]
MDEAAAIFEKRSSMVCAGDGRIFITTVNEGSPSARRRWADWLELGNRNGCKGFVVSRARKNPEI